MARPKKTTAEEKQKDEDSSMASKGETESSRGTVVTGYPSNWDPKLSDEYLTAEMMILSLKWPKESAIAAVRQGVTSWRVMARLSPAKVKELCATIRKPGGGVRTMASKSPTWLR